MEEDAHLYGGRQLLVCKKTLISPGKPIVPIVVVERRSLHMEEDAHLYEGRQLLVCKKTLISMQEDSDKALN